MLQIIIIYECRNRYIKKCRIFAMKFFLYTAIFAVQVYTFIPDIDTTETYHSVV